MKIIDLDKDNIDVNLQKQYKNSSIDLSNYFSKIDYENTKKIANVIANNNGNLYLVGGCVRDIILGVTPHDYDFCVTGITSLEFLELFPEAKQQGKHFPVYILNNHEFALARKEITTGPKHTDFKFLTSSDISIYEDLIRRDLTVNSIAINFISQEIIDPFNGIQDIKNKILKITSTAFTEDPLRVYRVARFASQLNFNIDINTIQIMKTMKDELSTLSVERIFVEFRKALLSNNPTNFFKVLRECNCLEVHFKEIFNLINVEQPLEYHPEGDAYNHTLEVLERVSLITNNELTRFGALVHDFGKAATPKSNWPHHYDHNILGVPIIKEFCHKLKMPNSYLKAGCTSSAEHMLAGIYNKLRPGTKVDFFERVYKSKSLTLKGLEIIANCDSKKDLIINFADIGEKVMKNVKLNISEINVLCKKNDITKTQKGEKIKQLLKEKRIKYLQFLEKNI